MRIGGYVKYGGDAGHETRRGIAVRIHPRYSPDTEENDVALILLDRSSTRATIRLPRPSRLPAARFGAQLTAVGWGLLADGGPSARVLQEVCWRVGRGARWPPWAWARSGSLPATQPVLPCT